MIGSPWHHTLQHPGRWDATGVGGAPCVDTVLAARARAGDLAAFESLVRRHVQPVYWVARQALPADLADEVVVEVFVRAWHNLDRSGPVPAEFRTWITMVTAQVCCEANTR